MRPYGNNHKKYQYIIHAFCRQNKCKVYTFCSCIVGINAYHLDIYDTEGKTMKKTAYKSLDQLVGDSDERVPLSTRVKKDTKVFLDKEAKARKVTVSTLSAAILDDYIQNLKQEKRG